MMMMMMMIFTQHFRFYETFHQDAHQAEYSVCRSAESMATI